jgi:hypothetical protein
MAARREDPVEENEAESHSLHFISKDSKVLSSQSHVPAEGTAVTVPPQAELLPKSLGLILLVAQTLLYCLDISDIDTNPPGSMYAASDFRLA